MNTLKLLLSDKKFLAALAVVIVGVGTAFGLQWTEAGVSDAIMRLVEAVGVILSFAGALYAGKRVADKTTDKTE